jgi:hypothetical protein
MEYHSNVTQIENAKLLSGNLNGRIYNGIFILIIILLFLTRSLFLSATKLHIYVQMAFALIFSALLYIPYTIKRIRVLKNIVTYIDIFNNQTIFRTSEINILFSKIKYGAEEVHIQRQDKIEVEMDAEVKLTNFKTEIFTIDLNGTKYYVIGAYFENYEGLKRELFPVLKGIIGG